MVSWEYPPVVVGGLGRHVHHLATALAAAGHEVVVLSRRPPTPTRARIRRPTRSVKGCGSSRRPRIPMSSRSAPT
ncbi:glycogen/starch synthase [Mycolicibacterium mageritense]|uniref:glycogen/starch synthase n=1 Tax=Mycolicibacterium mageritense TaxID=53462 RepID=UPI003898F25A